MAQRDLSSFSSARIVLGTAQLGMRYGIANQTGQPDPAATRALLQRALSAGLSQFDTAAVYGDSETVLGDTFRALHAHDKVFVITKGSGLALNGESLTQRVKHSLSRLGLSSVGAWLLHDQSHLAVWKDDLRAEAKGLIDAGVVTSFGASVYSPEMALRAVEDHGLTSLQFPANPFDRRFLRGDVFERLKRSGARIYVRSVYLQGLGLMSPEVVPAHIFRAREAVSVLARFCSERELARDHFCLHYVLRRTASMGARLVIGLETEAQLARNVALLTAPPLELSHLEDWDRLWPDDLEDLVLPFRWNAQK